MYPTYTPTVCPSGHHADAIQKVTAIIAGQTINLSGTREESYTYTDSNGKTHTGIHTVPYQSTSVSALAQKLAMPTEPPAKSFWHMIWSAILFGLLCGGLFVIALPVTLIQRSLDLGGVTHIIALILSIPLAIITLPFEILFFVLLLFTPLSILEQVLNNRYPWVSQTIHKKLPWLGKKLREEEEQSKHEHQWWVYEKSRWEQLYYCHKHDIVFIPSEGRYVGVNDMRRFLRM